MSVLVPILMTGAAARRHSGPPRTAISASLREVSCKPEPVTCGYARREGFEPPTARSVAWCSASDWSTPDGSGLLTLGAPSVQTAPEGSRRIVWMIKRMIKPRDAESSVTQTTAVTGERAPDISSGDAWRTAATPSSGHRIYKPAGSRPLGAGVCRRGRSGRVGRPGGAL